MSYSNILKKAFWWFVILALFLNLFLPMLRSNGSWSKFSSMFSFSAFIEAFFIALIAVAIFFYFKEEKDFKLSPSWELTDPLFHSKILKAITWVLLFLNIPQIVMIEEEIFRSGTESFFEIIARSLGFGFAHMLIGAPFGVACILSGIGVWLSIHYLEGGINSSFWFHTAYNIWILTFIVIAFLYKKNKKR